MYYIFPLKSIHATHCHSAHLTLTLTLWTANPSPPLPPDDIPTHHDHSDGEVWSQLIVSERERRADSILVDTALVDELRVRILGVTQALTNPEMSLEVLLYQTIPVAERHSRDVT